MNIHFGENIHRLRTERGMTQERLADFLGVSFQAVSKWERGESVPDVFMLPVISNFFGVSVDYLLGVDKSEQEKEVEEYIELYSSLWQQSKYEDVLKTMKKAIKEYPAEYSLLVRYLNALIWCNTVSAERALSIKNEVESAYERISKYCTVDSIRIWAKKLMCKYYKRLNEISVSGVVFDDIKKILDEMPLMQNSRDFLIPTLCPDDESKSLICKNTINELIYLLTCTVKELTTVTSCCTDDEKLQMLESVIGAVNAMCAEENYGKSYINIAFLFAECGILYSKLGDSEKAEKLFNKSKSVAEKFDSLSFVFTESNGVLKDVQITKKDIPMSQAGNFKNRIEKYINNCTIKK